jgi:hypothetical protein
VRRSYDAARDALNAWKSVPLGRFSAATSFELGPISRDLASIDFSAGFSEKSARVLGSDTGYQGTNYAKAIIPTTKTRASFATARTGARTMIQWMEAQ